MRDFATKKLPVDPDATAPDGSDVRILLDLDGEIDDIFDFSKAKFQRVYWPLIGIPNFEVKVGPQRASGVSG